MNNIIRLSDFSVIDWDVKNKWFCFGNDIFKGLYIFLINKFHLILCKTYLKLWKQVNQGFFTQIDDFSPRNEFKT